MLYFLLKRPLNQFFKLYVYLIDALDFIQVLLKYNCNLALLVAVFQLFDTSHILLFAYMLLCKWLGQRRTGRYTFLCLFRLHKFDSA